jgi:hypothetical protein
MLDVVLDVLEVLSDINANIDMNTYRVLDNTTEACRNIINQLNSGLMSHYADLLNRDRIQVNHNVISNINRDPNTNIGPRYREIPRLYEMRLRIERLSNLGRINNLNANVLERAHISDPSCDRLKTEQQELVNSSYTLVRSLLRNHTAASQLQNCATRAPTIASHIESLQDSVD